MRLPLSVMTGPTWPAASRQVVFSDIFFFQAEDGIRDLTVTGVQTCALPISLLSCPRGAQAVSLPPGGAGTSPRRLVDGNAVIGVPEIPSKALLTARQGS